MVRPVTMLLMLAFLLGISAAHAGTKIPVLYSTDLHHPHMDPDDHFDLATLFSLPELDVRGIVLDCGAQQQKAPGSVPVKQMLHLTGRQVPFAIGLEHALRSPDDDGRDQPDKFQRGVTLMLDVLRDSPKPVTVFTTGSLRDVAAAFNRQPELLRRKIARLYINIGNPAVGADSRQWEYNVKLDPSAYCCIMRSGLPIYWCPCFDGGVWQRGRHGTYWKFVQSQVLNTAPKQLQNWFVYALTKPQGVDPVKFLTMPQDPDARARVWKMPRNMWCTGPLLHAAGRRVYRRRNGEYVALSPAHARQQGLADKPVDAFGFVAARMKSTCDQDGTVHVSMKVKPKKPNGFVFSGNSDDYDKILTSCLKNLLTRQGRGPGWLDHAVASNPAAALEKRPQTCARGARKLQPKTLTQLGGQEEEKAIVSDLRAEFRLGQVFLHWKEHPENSQNVRVYISSTPITASTLDKARLLTDQLEAHSGNDWYDDPDACPRTSETRTRASSPQ